MMNREIKPGTCECCRFWRDKGWANDGGIGKCDSPDVIKQVRGMNAEMIKHFVNDERDAGFIANSIRFENTFGCIHHKELTVTEGGRE
jgi:hypothetical protein